MAAVPYLSGAFYVPPPPPPVAPAFEAPKQVVERLPISEGDNLEQILVNAGIDQALRLELIEAFDKAYDIRKVRAGRELVLTRWEKTREVASLEYTADADHQVRLFRTNGVSSAELVEIPGVVKQVPVCARLQDSLAETMERTGENFMLAMMMADVLAYDIDFYRDPQPGDDFCLVVEKKFYENGQAPTYRRILGARYNNAGHVADAYYFTDPASTDGKGAYYGSKGESLKSAFLRSPLEFDARVSSHFSMNRLHPVLHTVRAHYGTDYAAPTGTPVRAVAAGKIVGAGMSGGSGNLVTIRHNGGLQTQYLHLSRIFVKVGQQVEQGTRIGAVGMTGLASGPHLDIRISRNGSYLNWEKMRSPRTEGLTGKPLESFSFERDRMIAMMDTLPKVPQVAQRAGPVTMRGN